MTNSKTHIFLVLIFAALSLNLFAQTELSAIKKLTNGADVILTGKVTNKTSTWNENKTRIFTTARLQVRDLLKGSNNRAPVEIVYPGGEVGDVGEIYTHMPTFAENEEVLVFLKKDLKKNKYVVLNGEEGKIPVLQDVKTEGQMTSSNQKIEAIKKQIRKFVNEQ